MVLSMAISPKLAILASQNSSIIEANGACQLSEIDHSDRVDYPSFEQCLIAE